MLSKIYQQTLKIPKAFNKIRAKLLGDYPEEEPLNISLSQFEDIIFQIEELEGTVLEEYYIEKPFAKVLIKRLHDNTLLYELITPPCPLSDTDFEDFMKSVFYSIINITQGDGKGISENILWDAFLRVVSKRYRHYSLEQLASLWYHLYTKSLGLGPLTPLLKDPNIEDITCNGWGLPIYVYHRKYTYLRTNIVLNEDELDELVATVCNRQGVDITYSNPIVDLALPDGSRLNVTFKNVVSDRGTSFTIRKVKDQPFTALHLIQWDSIPLELVAYLWLALDLNASIMIVGATASGKTTLLNAIALLIRPNSKIVSIEDTREIQLPHENWTPLVATPEIDSFKLMITTLRQRPEYIIVGEARGEEVRVLFQAMSTGHPCLTTMHAGSSEEIIKRLNSPPYNIQPQTLTLLNIIVTVGNVGTKEKPIRKTIATHFLKPTGQEHEKVIDGVYIKEIQRYNFEKEKFEFNRELALQLLSEFTHRTVSYLSKELDERIVFLNNLLNQRLVSMYDLFEELKKFKQGEYYEQRI